MLEPYCPTIMRTYISAVPGERSRPSYRLMQLHKPSDAAEMETYNEPPLLKTDRPAHNVKY